MRIYFFRLFSVAINTYSVATKIGRVAENVQWQIACNFLLICIDFCLSARNNRQFGTEVLKRSFQPRFNTNSRGHEGAFDFDDIDVANSLEIPYLQLQNSMKISMNKTANPTTLQKSYAYIRRPWNFHILYRLHENQKMAEEEWWNHIMMTFGIDKIELYKS